VLAPGVKRTAPIVDLRMIIGLGDRIDPDVIGELFSRSLDRCLLRLDVRHGTDERHRLRRRPRVRRDGRVEGHRARRRLAQLLDDVLQGAIDPGRVFDHEVELDHVADAYSAMDERRAIESLARVEAI